MWLLIADVAQTLSRCQIASLADYETSEPNDIKRSKPETTITLLHSMFLINIYPTHSFSLW